MFFDYLTHVTQEALVLVSHETVAERCREVYRRHTGNEAEIQGVFFLTLENFIQQWWFQTLNSDSHLPRLLNPTESLGIWVELLTQEQAFCSFATIVRPYEAWTTLQKSTPDVFLNATKQWCAWAKKFEQYCLQKGVCDLYAAGYYLIKKNAPYPDTLSKHLKLLDLDLSSYQTKRFMEYFHQQGCTVEPINQSVCHDPGPINSIFLQEPTAELQLMAHWMSECFNPVQPQTVIGVIQNLNERLGEILPTFEVLPRSLHPLPSPNIHLPFATSSLAEAPLTQLVLDIISPCLQLEHSRLERLLYSPYTNSFNRSELQQQWRILIKNTHHALYPFDYLVKYAQLYECDTLANHLKTWHRQALRMDQEAKPSTWVRHWNNLLKLWGFCRETDKNKTENYYYNHIAKILNTFSELDGIHAQLSIERALELLQYHLTHTRVLVHVDSYDTGLYLIDSQDIPKSNGEIYWVTDLSRSETVLNNPFILKTQPPQNKTLSTAIARATQQFIYSHTAPIPTVSEITFQSMTVETLGLKKLEYNNVVYDVLEDDWATPLRKDEQLRQGTDVLKKQAICPFRAFGDYRLGLKQSFLPSSLHSPSAFEKSILLHRILKRLWGHVNTHSNLLAFSQEDLEGYLKTMINDELQSLRRKKANLWTQSFVAVERERLYALLQKLITLEKKRPPFTIHALEQKRDFTLGPLKLSLIIDRVDQIDTNDLLLIDYKTGSQPLSVRDWFGERIEAPQLVLYTLSYAHQSKALAWLQLHPEYGGKFIGLSAYTTGISGIQVIKEKTALATWNHILKDWHASLENLATSFSKGYAKVDPKEGVLSCKHCQYSSLCRIFENR